MAASSSSKVVMMVVMMVMPMMVVAGETVMNPVVPKEGEEFLLECEGEGPMAYFLLHQKGYAMPVGFNYELNIEVFQNATVSFKTIETSHAGVHLCLRSTSEGAIHGYQAPLSVRPLPPSDLWEEVYETKFVTGFLAALVVAAAFILGALVYKYRWQPRPETDGVPIYDASSGYDNPAMNSAEDIENVSTKM